MVPLVVEMLRASSMSTSDANLTSSCFKCMIVEDLKIHIQLFIVLRLNPGAKSYFDFLEKASADYEE